MSPTNRVGRREALVVLGAAGLGAVAGCGASPTSASSTTTSANTGGGSAGTSGTSACAVAPEETAGPYPDRIGMVNNSSYFRQDVTEGKSGIPLMLTLTVVNVRTGCTGVAGANVEIWQCDAVGNYSEYAQPGYDGTSQTFLRGVQTADANGRVTFRTIYPGWYAGRATHIHVEVFVNGTVVKTTQIAFPEDVSSAVYRTSVYSSHGQNTTSNAQDNVFSDGTSGEMAALSGDTTSGYTATLTIGVSV
jgi:protocatechuate 3,4-dioxygenase beta subunit